MKAYQVLCQFFLLCCIAVFPAVNGGLHQTPLVSLLANDEEDHSHQMLPNTNSFSAIPQHSIIQGRELQTHGTTTLAFVHHDRILLCIDSKASMGSYISSRNVKKIFPLGPNAVATMAGGAADCSFWIRRVAHSVKLLEERHATPFPISAKARLLSTFLKEYRGRDLSVGTMVAGVDNKGPQLYYVDSEGSCIAGDIFCVGSGSKLAYSILDNEGIQSKDGLKGLSKDEAIRIATWAVRHATYRDGFSGGYINIIEVSESGIKHLKRIDCRDMTI